MRNNVLLKNGYIVDGTGGDIFKADVQFVDNKIVAIGQNIKDVESRVIDCAGQYIAPGFIDAHSHMDFYAATKNPEYFDSFTHQGITTFIGGNCGFSPCTIHTDSEHNELLEKTLFEVPDGREILCKGVDALSERIVNSPIKHNFYHMVGHGSYRTSLSGFDVRDLESSELQELLESLDEALEGPAVGISLGLQYKPGVFVKRPELVEVAKVVKRHDKVLAVHAKAYSSLSGTYPLIPFGRAHNLKAIDEMISIAEETGVRLQFSHLIFVGERTWKTIDEALRLFDEARARGVDICFDMFPYPCGATLLNTVLPDWFMAGMPEITKSKMGMARIKLEMGLGTRLLGFSIDNIQLSYPASEKYKKYEGKSVKEIARDTKQSGIETLVDILAESDSQARVLNHGYYGPGNIEKLMRHEASIFSTDAWPEIKGLQNPAAFGSFPRFLQVARETGNISLEQCIHKMTGTAAERFQLNGRGLVKEGFYSDLVVFDWDDSRDNTSLSNFQAKPDGIKHVFINGEQML